ncbi:MAG: ATP-dependent DNA ligase [Rhodospirillales bacterium]|nr:ATP-dependent DNA ligase [Rhodospirillales bacterium]
MLALAVLLDDLTTLPTEARRIARIVRYLAATPDAKRGWGLAVLAGAIRPRTIGPAAIHRLAEARCDPVLFALSRDFVGDATETLALLWPPNAGAPPPPGPAEAIAALEATLRAETPTLLAAWLDGAESPAARHALLRFVTGGLRRASSGPLARAGFAAWAGLDPAEVAAVWHAVPPPYEAMFAWAERRAPPPDPGPTPGFHPPMHAAPIADAEFATLDRGAYRAEWAWAGSRVQIVAEPAGRRLYSASAEDLSAAYPDLLADIAPAVTLDGILLAGTGAPRLRLFDILREGTEDLRALSFDTRRARLEAWYARAGPPETDLSPLLDPAFPTPARQPGTVGLVLKRRDSPYHPGSGAWRSWRYKPHRIEAVLMYAEPEITFGVWNGATLVAVGKAAYDGLEAWIRTHTIARFGPVRETAKTLVLEIAFDTAEAAPRRKSGLVLRGARILGPRPDRQAADAARLATLRALLPPG